MAESSPAANCLEKLKTYVKTQKGVILAAEIVSIFLYFSSSIIIIIILIIISWLLLLLF